MTVERMIELLEIEKKCVLRNASGECNRYCAGCDLLQDDTELHEMYTEAIALLKAQEPRVMTLTELERTEVAYADDKDKTDIIPVLVKGRRYDRFAMVKGHLGDGTSHVFHPSIYDYGKRWRCWTSRPTQEQREAIPWN